MEPESKATKWSPQSLLDNRASDYCLMLPVAVADGHSQLAAAGFERCPGVGTMPFEIWIDKMGRPQMVPFADYPHCKFFDGESLNDTLNSAVD